MSISNTVVVGAGPYGLSIAAHLKAAGIPYDLYGTPLESWRKFMPQGMVLKSERFASNLWDPNGKFTLEALLGRAQNSVSACRQPASPGGLSPLCGMVSRAGCRRIHRRESHQRAAHPCGLLALFCGSTLA